MLDCVQDLGTSETKTIDEAAVAGNAVEVTTKSSKTDLKCRLTRLFDISMAVDEMPIVSIYLRFLHAVSTCTMAPTGIPILQEDFLRNWLHLGCVALLLIILACTRGCACGGRAA